MQLLIITIIVFLFLYSLFSTTRILMTEGKSNRKNMLLGIKNVDDKEKSDENFLFSFFEKVTKKFGYSVNNQNESFKQKLMQSGIRDERAYYIYVGIRLIGLVLGIAVVLATLIFKVTNTNILIFGLILAGAGYLLPDFYLNNRAKNRSKSIKRALPDCLDLLVICAEAGLSIDNAFVRVSKEIARLSEELSQELQITAVEFSYLPERRKALINLSERVDLQAFRSVINTLIQAEKYGTPLSHSLRVFSKEFREQRILEAEEKAARLPATLTVPMILFILPTLFVVLAGPAMIEVYDSLSN